MYIPCHVHTTEGSVGDATLKVKEYIKKCKEMNLKAASVTNHGSMSDMYNFYIECKQNNIKPIIGCEIYECYDRTLKQKKKKTKKDLEEEAKLLEQGIKPIDNQTFHMVLLAINNKGVENLLSICADAELIGKYYTPRTDLNFLRNHSEGLICLTACVGGRIPQYLLDGKMDEAKAFLQECKNIFDNVYLEIQPGMFSDQVKANFMLIDLAEETNTELIITNDIHYLNQEDWRSHDAHVKSNRKQNINSDPIYPDTCYYLMDEEDITNRMLECGVTIDIIEKAIRNTEHIADISNIDLNTSIKMPKSTLPTGYTSKNLLESICLERYENIKYSLTNPGEYIERLYYELSVIEELDFCDYFLMVRDLVKYAKDNNIPIGPGRGSVCGSITAYLCEITAVDPIKYNLLFERFLSLHRKGSIPDVDLDFSSEKRSLMFDYARQKYGDNNCAQVATFSIRKAKAAIRDAAKLYDYIDLELEDKVAKLIPQVYYSENEEGGEDKLTDLSIEQSLLVVPELKEYYDIYPEWINTAINMEGLPKARSIHPAGTLISSIPLKKIIPLISQSERDINATSLDLSQAEGFGLVKMDFLGLSTLTVIDKVENMTGDKFDFEFNRYDDKKVWNLIGSKDLSGIFQISSKIYKDRMYKLQPKTIKELAACLALVRGPCISAKTDQLYMDILSGKQEIQKIHPLYDEVVKDTLGIMIYQEQLMKVCVNFGFTLEEGYKIMKHSSKKRFDELKSYEDRFMILAKEKGIDEHTSNTIFKMIVDSGLYSFNESHAIAYALLAYATAYYKLYYPTEFMSAELTNIYQNGNKDEEKLMATIDECRRLGIKFLPVDINISDWNFKPEGELIIRVGFCSISSFGDKACDEVLTKRPFKNIEDLIDKVESKTCGKRALVPLMLSGALGDRTEDYLKLCELRGEKYQSTVRIHNHLSIEIYADDSEIEELLLGYSFTTSPLNNFKKIGFKNKKINDTINMKGVVKRIKKHKDKDNNHMAFLTIDTADGSLDCVMFASLYKDNKKLKKDQIIDFKIKKNKDNGGILMQVN